MKKVFRNPLLILFFFFQCFTTRAQVPVLNSYPSASATIFLDFDGHLVEGTSWNYSGPIQCGPSNLTSDQMTEIFNRVSEDYRPFNVNITTDSVKFLAAPINQRMRVIFTTTWEWYGAAGGVSYYGSFTWGDNTPAFVFTSLLNYNTKNVAEAGSHEAGHSLGLRHQSSYDANCTKTAEYNPGIGPKLAEGEIGWAPIMGVGYYRNQTLWNNGTDPYGCNSIQNDLQVITTSNGFGYRADDYGSGTNGSAATLAFVANGFSVNGVIEKSTDVDVFKFTMPSTAHFILNARPFCASADDGGANLDMQVELLSNGNTVIGVYNPADFLNAFIDTVLNAGSYFIRIQGKGSSFAPQFASLGSYTLQGNLLVETPLPLHSLKLQGRQAGNTHALSWVIDADEKVAKQTIEASTDGRMFKTVSTPPAAERNQTVTPCASTVYYRMLVQFDNGKQYYSNIIALRNNSASQPYLLSNSVQQTLVVNTSGNYTYQIADFSGRTLAKGQLQKGTTSVDCGHMAKGWYVIQLSTGDEIVPLRFLKQ